MASRESQGLQIALIIFVMVTVVLAVTTFVFYRKSEELRKAVADAQGKEKAARDGLNAENFKVQYLKHVLGAERLGDAEFKPVRDSAIADPQMKVIDDQYQQNMKTYGEGLSPDKLDYANLLPNMLNALRERNVANTELNDKVNALTQEKTQLQQTENARTKEAIAGLQKAKDDLASQTKQFEDDRLKLAKEKEDQLAGYKKDLGTYTAKVESSQKNEEATKGEMKKMKDTIDKQNKKLDEFRPRSFEAADGLVTWVNQRSNTVWINLGTADSLQRQTLFSVYGQEEAAVAQSERKASIEVTRVLSEHLSEARIVSDDPGNPILPGDQIFSPAWKPGERVHFALVGLLDVDGDGHSDRELVHNVIVSSGGEVDAETTETGQVTGEVTSQTRYLVLGTPPTDRKALDAWSKLISSAEQLGVQKLQLDQFLSWAGYKRETRTVPLGQSSRSSDFKPRSADATRTSSGNVSDVFEDRRAPAAKPATP